MKILKRIGIIIAVLIIILIITGIFISATYDDAVIRYLKKYLDKHLITEIEVDKIDFSLLKNFPRASVELKNIYARSTLNFSESDFIRDNTDTLLIAKSIFFEFALIKIFSGQYIIKNVRINDGILKILIDKNGRSNYNIWDPGGEKTGTGLNIDLQSLILTNIYLHINNLKDKYQLNAYNKKITVKGSLSNSIKSLITKGNIHIRNFSLGNKNIIKHKEFYFETDLLYRNNSYNIRKGKVKLGSMNFNIDGAITKGCPDNISLNISDGKVKLSEILSLFQNHLNTFTNNYSFNGNTYFNSIISGTLSKDTFPHIMFDFSVNNGTIINKKSKEKLSNIKINGSYTNGELNNVNTSSITVDEFYSSSKNILLNGKLSVNNFKSPHVKFILDSELDLNEISRFIKIDTLDYISGKLNTTIDLKGNISSLSKISKEDFLKLAKNCSLTFFNTEFKISNSELIVENINGKILIDESIKLNNMSFIADNNDFLVNGIFSNIFEFALLKNKNLIINAEVNSDYLNPKRLLSNQLQPKNRNNKSKNIYRRDVYLKTILSVKNFEFGKFNAANISGIINYSPGAISFEILRLNSCNGNINGHGSIITRDNNYFFQCQSELKSIDIDEFFYSFSNFGQNFIVDKNLKGNLSGDVKFSAILSKELIISKESITADGNLKIENGELIQFEPLMGLSKFISVEELSHIKFKTLNNEILIKDKIITIPEMDIYSSAMNITALGIHKFDNSYDYRIKVSMTDLLFNKAREKTKEVNKFGIVEDDGLGKITIPLKIKGKGDKYETSFDKQKAFSTLKKNIQNEKKVLKGIFRDEFYYTEKDSVKREHSSNSKNLNYKISWEEQYDKKDVIFENQDIKEEDSPEYIMEWDENEDTLERKND
jgi:hypothetical protein